MKASFFRGACVAVCGTVAGAEPVPSAGFIGHHGEAFGYYGSAENGGYSFGRFRDQTCEVKHEYALLFGAITVIGFANWDWGSASFSFNSEGWFSEENTGSGGMDKLGHAFASYAITDFLTYRIRMDVPDPRHAELTAGLLSLSLMTYVELFDGFSADHGFSYEDMTMNVLGIGFSMLRNSVPGLAEKVDFRMQYLPSPYDTFNPLGDYPGQKYLLAVKLAGFEALEDTPLRFVELHGGYSARGFTREERPFDVDKERNLYVGIGLNLSELFFGSDPSRDNKVERVARTGLRYVQVPYTYLSSDGNSGR